jgi:hypothetical protein
LKRSFGLLLVLLGSASRAYGQLPVLDGIKLSDFGDLMRDVRQMTFEGRAITLDSLAILQKLSLRYPISLEQDYIRFVDRALVIRGTNVVEDPLFQYDPFHDDPSALRGRWTFPNLLRLALTGFDPDKIATEIDEKIVRGPSPQLGSTWKKVDPKQRLNTIPLRLLAVTNRLDLARLVVTPGGAPGSINCPKGQLCGAEIHFVYSGIIDPDATGTEDSKPYLNLILEFVLPPLSKSEIRKLAWRWVDPFSRPAEHSAKDLDGLLTDVMQRWSQGPRTSRIRINAHEGNWTLLQFAVTKQGLIRTPLNQEPNINNVQNTCVAADSPVGKYVAKNTEAILRSDYDFYQPGAAPNAQDCKGGMDVPQRCAAILDEGIKQVLTLPANLVKPVQKTDAVRFSLSLNSCTGCHSYETRRYQVGPKGGSPLEPFNQLLYREKGQLSPISAFLGGGGDGRPHLYTAWRVEPPVSPVCGGPAPDAKSYNDLIRRAVFHLVILDLPDLDSPFELLDDVLDRIWSTALNRHGLTAWQPH